MYKFNYSNEKPGKEARREKTTEIIETATSGEKGILLNTNAFDSNYWKSCLI